MLNLSSDAITQALRSYHVRRQGRFAELFSTGDIKKLRPAAVIIPIFQSEGRWHVLLTQRSRDLVEHSGQVAFPGGAMDINDDDLQKTALREMHEEIGIDPGEVFVFGHLGDMPVITGYLVRLYVGQIPCPYNLIINDDEVDSAFNIPLTWLAEPSHRFIQYRSYAGRKFPVLFFDKFQGHRLWGASAEMMMSFLKALDLA